MQSFLHNHHRWFTFLVGSPKWKAIPIWIASLGKGYQYSEIIFHFRKTKITKRAETS